MSISLVGMVFLEKFLLNIIMKKIDIFLGYKYKYENTLVFLFKFISSKIFNTWHRDLKI